MLQSCNIIPGTKAVELADETDAPEQIKEYFHPDFSLYTQPAKKIEQASAQEETKHVWKFGTT